MDKKDEIYDIRSSRYLELIHDSNDSKKRSSVPEDLKLSHDIFTISDSLYSFYRDYGRILKILDRFFTSIFAIFILSFVPIALFVLYTIIRFFYDLWLKTDDNTKFNSAWTLLLLPVGAVIGAVINQRLRKNKTKRVGTNIV